MSTERNCKRCGGLEFLMMTPNGQVIAWRNQTGERGTWFCPNCDWGGANDTHGRAA